MSTTPPTLADRPAERSLFTHLVDDAAVFPPAATPLGAAVRAHLERRGAAYADLLGPLLVPVASAPDLLRLLDHHAPASAGQRAGMPLRVALVARPGADPAEVSLAVATLRPATAVEVVGVEMGWTGSWRDVDVAGLPLSLEVPRGDALAEAVADIAADASDAVPLQAKFRTGTTAQWAWPDEAELATFIRATIDHDLGFKLTGGLHHAVRADRPTADGGVAPEHGFLNVLVATRWALNGEEVDELVPLLAERDGAALLQNVIRMSVADAAIVRAFFTAYGCCAVTDPVGELTAYGLVEAGR